MNSAPSLGAAVRRDRLPLLLILLVGLALRVVNPNWDQNHHLHPDERFISMVASAIEWPTSIGQYFNTAESPLNPANRGHSFFVYGTLPLFAAKLIALPFNWDNYEKLYILGRVLSGVVDLGTVLLVYLMGITLYGRRTALLGAALMALTVHAIQLSHFFAFDTFTVFFTTLTVFYGVRLMRGSPNLDWVWLGVAFGCAMACKFSVATLPLAFGTAAAVAVFAPASWTWRPFRAVETRLPQRWELNTPLTRALRLDVRIDREAPLHDDATLARRERLAWAAGGLFVALAVGALTFRITDPYAFDGRSLLDWKPNIKFIESVDQQRKFVDGTIDFPPSHQYAFTPSYIFPTKDIVVWGMGVPLGIAAFAGTLWAAWEVWRRKRWEHLPLLIWIGFNFLYYGRVLAKGMRYFFPIYPMMVLLAAYALVQLFLWAREARARRAAAAAAEGAGAPVGRSAPPWRRAAVGFGLAAPALVVAGTLFYALAFVNGVYLSPMTRIAATYWIYDNVPAGATIANEHWDDALPLGLGPGRDAQRFKGLTMNLYHDDNPAKRTELLQQLDQADYIFLTSNRLYGSIPRLPMRYPMTTEYYRLLFGGQLGFELAAKFTAHPRLLGVEWDSDRGMEVGGLRGFLQPDETYTVYDSPPVLIFRKTPAYNSVAVRQMIEAVPLDNVVNMTPVQAARAKNMVMLPEAIRERIAENGTWRALFDPNSLANVQPLLALLVLVEVLALAVWTLLLPVLRPLADRGWGISKALGVALLAYPVWALSATTGLPWSRWTLFAMALILVAGASYVAWKRGDEARQVMHRRGRALFTVELIFLAAYVGFSFVRLSNADLWHPNLGGEKSMDLAYLTATIRTDRFPAYDPWFAGGVLNYYAYGFVLVAGLAKLLGMLPSLAYNTAVPLWFALTAAAAAGVAYNLGILVAREVGGERRRLWPLFCAVFGAFGTVLFGNLGEFALVWQGWWQLGERAQGSALPVLGGLLRVLRGAFEWAMRPEAFPARNEWFYWNPTRVIPETINEFPYFTFLYGDLHAHMLALPFTLVALGLAVNVALGLSRRSARPASVRVARPARRLVPAFGYAGASPRALGIAQRFAVFAPPAPSPALNGAGRHAATAEVVALPGGTVPGWTTGRLDWLRIGLLSLVLAVVWMTNTWDLPTYAVIGAAALAAVAWLTREQTGDAATDWRWLPRLGLWLVVLGALTYAFALPFNKDYASAYGSVALWKDKHTLPVAYFTVHGLALTVLTVWAIGRLAERHHLLSFWPAVVAFGALGSVLWGLDLQLVAVLLPLVALAVAGTLNTDAGPGERFIHALFLAGLGLSIIPEVIVIEGDVGRMNTVFKLYLQVWCLWAIAVALALPWLLRDASTLRGDAKFWARALLVGLLALALLYPLLATPARARDRWIPETPRTLDGESFMTRATWATNNQTIVLAQDYAAIQWLRENVDGTPAIVEASGLPYTWQNRVTMFTGLPGMIGWDNHQRQQRGVAVPGVVERRLNDVKAIYVDGTAERTLSLLRQNHVVYVYMGALERAVYGPQSQPKLDALVGNGLTVAYDRDGVRIYRVD